MKALTATEKAKFEKAGILTDVTKEYYVDIPERTIVSENDIMAHFGIEKNEVGLKIATEDSDRARGVRSFSLSEINGSKKF